MVRAHHGQQRRGQRQLALALARALRHVYQTPPTTPALGHVTLMQSEPPTMYIVQRTQEPHWHAANAVILALALALALSLA
jgi:hypothetical protein